MNKYKAMVAYITGGVSGIGKAVADRILCQGGSVCLADLNSEGSKIAKSMGERAIFTMTDVTQECDVLDSIKATKEKFGRINVVVNSAGILALEPIYNFKTNTPHSIEGFKSQFDVNVWGTFNVIRLIAGIMAENEPDEDRQRGVIINLASMMAVEPPPMMVAYGASKSAVHGMTLPLARGLSPRGIRVVSIGPGFIESPMTKILDEQKRKELISLKLSPKRFGTCDEVAHLIQSVIENPIINGEYIRIDSGWRHSQINDSLDAENDGC